MNSRVPVIIEWDATPGQKIVEQAFTRIVSPYGCLLVLQHDISVEQKVQVTNAATQQANTGIFVWKGNKGPDGWELGIELTQPPMDFWGIEL